MQMDFLLCGSFQSSSNSGLLMYSQNRWGIDGFSVGKVSVRKAIDNRLLKIIGINAEVKKIDIEIAIDIDDQINWH